MAVTGDGERTPVLVLTHDQRVFAVRHHRRFTPAVQALLVATCEPVTRPAAVNEFAMSSESLAAAASDGALSAFDIAERFAQYATTLPPRRSALVEAGCLPPAASVADEDAALLADPVARRAAGLPCGQAAVVALPTGFAAALDAMRRATRLRVVLQPQFGSPGFVDPAFGAVPGPAGGPGVAGRARDAAIAAQVGADVGYDIDGASDSEDRDDKGASRRAPDASTGVVCYYLSAPSRPFLEALVARDRVVASYLQPPGAPGGAVAPLPKDAPRVPAPAGVARSLVFSDRDRSTGAIVFKAEVAPGCLRDLRGRIHKFHDEHADAEYDFRSDATSVPLPLMCLRDASALRPYQEAALERFLRGGRARNGVIVLPCGAGKTLTGIAACCAVRRPVIVLCINRLSVYQWRDQFLRWSCVPPERVTVCTDTDKQLPGHVFITTYSMLISKVRVGKDAQGNDVLSEGQVLKQRILRAVRETAWGMLLLDEVHGAPADRFQEVLDGVNCHCILGLTATLLREDDRIADLRFLVGPKIYEANWLELTAAGHLAAVECVEVRCPTPPLLLAAYGAAPAGRRSNMEALNPQKVWCAQALVAYHTSRSPPDKVLVFCDSVHATQRYAELLGVPMMDGGTKSAERDALLSYFRSGKVNCIVLSRVGDTALDLPMASVVVQVSSLGASRRQEAQRLGRVLRPKPPALDRGGAFFYTLVSVGTAEVEQSAGRQGWLLDQGFAYRTVAAETIVSHYIAGDLRARLVVEGGHKRGLLGEAHPAAAADSASPVKASKGILPPGGQPQLPKGDRRLRPPPYGDVAVRGLCCVGQPRWQVELPSAPSAALAEGAGGLLPHVNGRSAGSSSGGYGAIRQTLLERRRWTALAPEISDAVERYFMHGAGRLTSDASAAATRPMGRPLRLPGLGAVTLFPDDLPRSNGVLTLDIAAGDETDSEVEEAAEAAAAAAASGPARRKRARPAEDTARGDAVASAAAAEAHRLAAGAAAGQPLRLRRHDAEHVCGEGGRCVQQLLAMIEAARAEADELAPEADTADL